MQVTLNNLLLMPPEDACSNRFRILGLCLRNKMAIEKFDLIQSFLCLPKQRRVMAEGIKDKKTVVGHGFECNVYLLSIAERKTKLVGTSCQFYRVWEGCEDLVKKRYDDNFEQRSVKQFYKSRNKWRAVDLISIQDEEDTTPSEITSNHSSRGGGLLNNHLSGK
ncbi:hypothetical protein Tco_0331587 [Tanacetum coccineum]